MTGKNKLEYETKSPIEIRHRLPGSWGIDIYK